MEIFEHCVLHTISFFHIVIEELRKKFSNVISVSCYVDVHIIKASLESLDEHPETLIGENILLNYAKLKTKSPYFISDKSTLDKVYDICEMT